MKALNRAIGQLTENFAAQALIRKGYQILERNFANKFGEIDLIAQDQSVLVFVEVKAKTGIHFGLPEEMITKSKLAKIRRMANLYLQDKTCACRIDVVAIVLDRHQQPLRLTHYQNVY